MYDDTNISRCSSRDRDVTSYHPRLRFVCLASTLGLDYFSHTLLRCVFYLGIEFYLFVSHGGMKRQLCALRNLHVDPLSLHTSMRNKQVEFNPYIYTLTKLYRFGYEISVFLIPNTRSLFYGRHYSSLHRLMSLHGKLNVKIFLMFIVADNTRSVNIKKYAGINNDLFNVTTNL